MNVPPLHPWALGTEEATRLQDQLRRRLVLSWDGRPVRKVGGVDMSIRGDQGRAALVVLRYPSLSPLDAVTVDVPLTYPYIPGLFAFREGPACLAAWEKLEHKPDLLMFDGQGIAHSRGLGIAAHLGLWLEIPTIGVAKSRLYGRHEEVGPQFGDWVALWDESDPGRVIGAVLRTRRNTRPLFISPGHLIDLEHSLDFVLACCCGYRLPDPTRWAHKVGKGEQGIIQFWSRKGLGSQPIEEFKINGGFV